MEDAAIVALYWARDEQALSETAAKFGAYCRKIADNILHSAHDAEECENDTWLAAWRPIWGASRGILRLTALTKPQRRSAAAARALPRWTSLPNV